MKGSFMSDILLLNGPDLNLLGVREPDHYGADTLSNIVNRLAKLSADAGLSFDHHQDNAEVGLIEKIHQAHKNKTRYIIINPAAFTHTSIALRDALLAVDIPFCEVHLSNVHKREDFRKKSYFSDVAAGVILGLGVQGYEFALSAAIKHINSN